MKRVAVRNKLLHPRRVRQFYSFGANSLVDRPIWLYGAQQIAIGAGVVMLEGGWLAVEKQAWDLPAPVLSIGDGTAIRIGYTISAAESITLEENVGMGASCTIIDSKHTWSSGHDNALYSPIETAPVRIGKGSWLADRATVIAGTDIGEQCAIGSNSVVGGKIPDFSIVLGNPGRVIGSTRT
jgi:acetyltransferase-like isoleucine patch superfamily enzyme